MGNRAVVELTLSISTDLLARKAVERGLANQNMRDSDAASLFMPQFRAYLYDNMESLVDGAIDVALSDSYPHGGL